MKVAIIEKEISSEFLWCNFNHSISNFIFSFVSGIRTQKPYLDGLTKYKGGKSNLDRRSTSVYKNKSSLIYLIYYCTYKYCPHGMVQRILASLIITYFLH